MNAVEFAGVAKVGAEPRRELLHDLVGVALQLLGAVLRELGDGRLRGVPVTGTVLVEVGRRAGKSPQCIAEHGRRLPRHDAAELDAAILDPAVSGVRRGRGPEVDRSRHPSGSGELAEVRDLAVEPQRQRAGPVHVLLEDRHPVVGEISGQLELHPRVVDCDVRRQDQRIAVALLPQAVNDGRHQPQHAARALELHQRRPVRVQAVEDLGMDRIGGLDPLLVIDVPTLGGNSWCWVR